MKIKSQNTQSYPAHLAIVYLINDFLTQKLDSYLSNTSMIDLVHNKSFIINSIQQAIQTDLRLYLNSTLNEKPYCLFIHQMKYLPEYIDDIISMWNPLINKTLETKISYLQSIYFNTQIN